MELASTSSSAAVRFLTRLSHFFDYFFGLIVIWLILGGLSAIPILHFLTLGYLLAASARVAASGKLRDGLIGLRLAAPIGKIIIAGWIFFLPIRLLHSYWYDAQIIDPHSQNARGLGIFLVLLIAAAVLVILWALIRGGRFRHFLWFAPLKLIRWMGEPKKVPGSWFLVLGCMKKSIRLWDFFKLGFFGFVGGFLWLILPISILFLASLIPNQGLSFLVSLLGGLLLGVATLYVPFLQTRYAISRKFSEFKNWREVRGDFRKAPLALWLALFVTLLFALPLYILKIELTPNEVAWIPNLVFVFFMFPARLLLGWANSRSLRRMGGTDLALGRLHGDRHWFFRLLGRLGMLPAVSVYVFVVWLSQYLSWHGSFSLFEQHAFLLPAPMLGL